MNRIARTGRRYGRGNDEAKLPGTHLIKISASTGVVGPGTPKFNGFCVYHSTKGNDNKFIVDYEGMKRLGYEKEQIDRAIQLAFKADPGLLPQTLRFILMNDAVDTGEKDDHGNTIWNYPRMYASTYICYDKMGRFCRGDGMNAFRRQDDGTEKVIECNPFGKKDVDPANFCKFSGPDAPCKLNMNFACCLYYWEKSKLDPSGVPLPGARPSLVSPSLGEQAIYVFSTTSEYMDMDLLDSLDRLANRLNGRLNGITGTMTFMKTGRRTHNEKTPKTITGYVFFQFDESSISAREFQLLAESDKYFSRQIEAAKSGVTLQLTAPIVTHESTIDAETVAPIIDAPDGMDADYQPADVTTAQEVVAEIVEQPPVASGVAGSDDATLVQALAIWAERIVGGDKPQEVAAELNKLASDAMGRKVAVVDRPAWFLRGEPGDRDTKRRELLRAICLKLEAENDPAFTLGKGDEEL